MANPVATYGECLVIFVQNIVLVLLLWRYNKTSSSEQLGVVVTFAAAAYGLVGSECSCDVLSYCSSARNTKLTISMMQLHFYSTSCYRLNTSSTSTAPPCRSSLLRVCRKYVGSAIKCSCDAISWCSLTRARKSHDHHATANTTDSIFAAGHTGHLSFITVIMTAAGSVARVFTAMQEGLEPVVVNSNALGAFWNVVILVQMLWFWQATTAALSKKPASGKAKKTSTKKASAKKTD
jgi:hypothetical protein